MNGQAAMASSHVAVITPYVTVQSQSGPESTISDHWTVIIFPCSIFSRKRQDKIANLAALQVNATEQCH